jgi:hypothetical protein
MKISKLGRTLLITLVIAMFTTGAAFASEGEEVEVIGTVIGIFAEDLYLLVEVEDTGEELFVYVGQNFDFDAIAMGDVIELSGIVNDEGALEVSELKIQERARDQVKLQDGELDSYYCANEDQVHPVAVKIAGTYGVDYSVIEDYLCGEPSIPLGQIMLAMQTAALGGGDYTEYLDGFENIGWGQIWQDLEFQGKPDHGTPPGQIQAQDGENDPEGGDPQGQMKKNGEGLEELILEWLPQGWFQKGKK